MLGKYIRYLRTHREKALSQQQLANACGLSGPYISLIENETAHPTLETIDTIARAFGLRAGDLLVKAGYTSNPAQRGLCAAKFEIECSENGSWRVEQIHET